MSILLIDGPFRLTHVVSRTLESVETMLDFQGQFLHTSIVVHAYGNATGSDQSCNGRHDMCIDVLTPWNNRAALRDTSRPSA